MALRRHWFNGSTVLLAAIFCCFLAAVACSGPVFAQGLFGDGDAQRREAETNLHINQLEGQIRNLNGQIEQLGFQLRQMQDQMLKMQKDTEFRLQELENGPQTVRRPPKKTELTPSAIDPSRASGAPQSTMAAPVADMPIEPSNPAGSTALADQGSAVDPGTDAVMPPAPIGQQSNQPRQGPGGPQVILGTPPQILGQIPRSDDPLSNGQANQPMDFGQPPRQVQQPLAALPPASSTAPRYANVQPTPSARDEYDAAYGYILSGEYELAERSFKTFLANHPTDRRAGSAQYWLGESYFQRNLHREATDAFLKSYTQYPDDIKAPDSLLKLGLAYQGLGERRAACNAYDELLTKYPKASKALRDRAALEKSRGKCV